MIEARNGAVRRRDQDEELATTIAEAVAAARGEDPTDLPPLQKEVDLDALERLFDSQGDASAGEVQVRLEIADCVVTVEDGVAVNVRRLSE